MCRNKEGEIVPKWLFIYKELGKCQNEYYTGNPNWLRFCNHSNVPDFST